MKKIALTIAICVACSAGIFFGVRKLNQSKKTVTVSISELNELKSDESERETVVEKQEEVMTDSEIVVKQVDEEKVENSQPISDPVIKKDAAVAIEKKQMAVEEKANVAGKIIDKLVSWGFSKSSGRKIDTIIVHSSYNSLGGDEYSPDKIINIYKQYEVSAHYLIGRDGAAYRLVEDQNIAWHAGVSKVPDGRTNTNDFSIGIEMINTMDGKYTEQQYDALNQLIKNLKSKYEIKYILGHNEIAPGRKTDPWGIDWKKVNR